MGKIKIIQIESVYKQHLVNLFGTAFNVHGTSYNCLLSELLNSGWSSGQNVGIYLNPNEYEIHYLVPTFMELQFKWFNENAFRSNIPKIKSSFMLKTSIKMIIN